MKTLETKVLFLFCFPWKRAILNEKDWVFFINIVIINSLIEQKATENDLTEDYISQILNKIKLKYIRTWLIRAQLKWATYFLTVHNPLDFINIHIFYHSQTCHG